MLGKGPKAYSKSPAKEEKERLSSERDKIKFFNVRFENRQVVPLMEEDEGKTFPICIVYN